MPMACWFNVFQQCNTLIMLKKTTSAHFQRLQMKIQFPVLKNKCSSENTAGCKSSVVLKLIFTGGCYLKTSFRKLHNVS